MNNRGELMAVRITPGNTDDRKPLEAMVEGLQGKLLGDKGYISQALFERLWQKGLHGELCTTVQIYNINSPYECALRAFETMRVTVEGDTL